ncbi:MAG: DNA repair protein RadA [Patescibacteria group bacterium]|nr:DNA repair protein RadA [Patescibacteria group bacterium]
MSKDKSVFVCSQCGGEHLQWQGRCQFCGEWNTLKELRTKNEKLKTKDHFDKGPAEIVKLDQVKLKDFSRVKTGIGEFDRVLGAGIVPGSVILLGGDPGIGKSTILLQLADKIKNTLYVSGEESAEQIKLRAERLGIKNPEFSLFTETDISEIVSKLTANSYKLIIIDSIQTMYVSDYPSTPGSLVQVRESALRLQQAAKALHIPIILVGHMTKGGEVAGPKTLEHLVDVVLYLEGERYHDSRVLRGAKNRFGATDEIGIFEMGEKGMQEVKNPSKIFLEERATNVAGSVVTATMEGTRPLLVEIQALCTPTSFGYPKRTASGFDLNRLNLLAAVLMKRAGLNLSTQDIYLNIAGGFKLKDPGIDLAVCAAIASAFKNKPINGKLCLFGEVGLSGEIRRVRFSEKRNQEAKRLGFASLDAKIKNVYQLIREIL